MTIMLHICCASYEMMRMQNHHLAMLVAVSLVILFASGHLFAKSLSLVMTSAGYIVAEGQSGQIGYAMAGLLVGGFVGIMLESAWKSCRALPIEAQEAALEAQIQGRVLTDWQSDSTKPTEPKKVEET